MDLSESKTEWVKFGKIKQLTFVGKEFICTGSGCHMIFINVLSSEEVFYHAHSKPVGEGVRTFVGHKTLSVFAFAEKCRFPRVFIMTCPAFATIAILDKKSNEDYMSIAFSEGDYLITLNDTPSFAIIIWNWRNGQRIASLDSDIFGKYQLIKCNLSAPIYFAQIQTGHTKLNLWDVAVCGKQCVLTPHRIEPPNDSGVFSDILWTTEGTLFVLDMLGHAYALSAENELKRVIQWEGEGSTTTSFAWYRAGLTIAGPNGQIKHFKKVGDWICDWDVVPPLPMKKISANYKDLLIGISEDVEIMQYDFAESDFKFIKQYQSKFNDVCMIYPTGEYFVTLQHNRELTAWEIVTGEMKDRMILKGKALAIKENPEYPYVGVTYTHGVLELISVYNPAKLTTMCSFNLSKNPLNSIYFTEIGKLIVAANIDTGEFFVIEGIPGSKMEIIATLETHRQICDYMLVASRTCMRLFVIYVTSDLYIAGDKIGRYCLIRDVPGGEVKEYQLESSSQMYSKIYATTKVNRDRVFYAISLTTKCIHEISTKRGDPLAKVVGAMQTQHQMKKIILHVDKYHAITYAYDGLVIIRNLDFTKQIGVVMPHYRTCGGVLKAYVSPLTKYVLSLGRDYTLVCTSLTNINISTKKHEELKNLLASARFTLMFKRPTTGFSPTGELEGKTWFEMAKIQEELHERQLSEKERRSILEEFKNIQGELQDLLTKNLEGPDDEKLDIQEFNLDVALKEEQIQQSREDCKNTKIYLEVVIAAQDSVSKWIKEFCWDRMRVQEHVVKAIHSNFEISNYVLIPSEADIITIWHSVTVYRQLERQMAEADIFEPWVPKSESELQFQLQKEPRIIESEKGANLLDYIEDEEHVEEEQGDADTETAFLGSVTHNFIELFNAHYTQQQVCGFLQSESEILFCLVEVYNLKEWYNKFFEDMMNQKVREVGFVLERNTRLRYILSELNYFSTEKFNIIIEDPVWSQTENPISVLSVDPKEVGITPYISPSEQAMLDAIAAEEERIRLLLLADDFRERALMAMMNGVLEVRWEDELKKDVPKPKCMLDKIPEEFNEEDLRAVFAYEEDVKFLNSERERYKKMLQVEYAKMSNTLREGIRKFNNRLADALLTNIQVDSAITQENLKIFRYRLKNLNRILKNRKEVEILQAIAYNHNEVEALHTLILVLHESLQELRSNAEALQAKEKLLEKAFKKDFLEASPVVQEQSIKLHKRRPKVNIRHLTSVTLTLEVAKCLITQERTLILTQDCFDYLKSLDTLDLYVNVPPAVDENAYAIVCKHRRFKIENELKIRASSLEIAEAESTIQTFQKLLLQKKEYGQKLLLDLDQVRSERLHESHNIQLQLILKQGLVEVPTTGKICDFDDAVMVSRKDVETINKIIVRGGKMKIKAMKETMNFRRGIISMEWEHCRLKMQIADLKSYIEDIESVKVTKEIQAYLKSRARGDSPDKGLSFEEELEIVKSSYVRMIEERKTKVKELQQKINTLQKENKELDEQIANINVDVCEYQLERDVAMEKREKDIIRIRMTTLLKRSNLIKQIQKNHSDILVLQTELELLRLKTYPTLSYTIFS